MKSNQTKRTALQDLESRIDRRMEGYSGMKYLVPAVGAYWFHRDLVRSNLPDGVNEMIKVPHTIGLFHIYHAAIVGLSTYGVKIAGSYTLERLPSILGGSW